MGRFFYRYIKRDVMDPFANDNLPVMWMFMHDKNTKHASKVVQNWFKNNNIEIFDWLA